MKIQGLEKIAQAVRIEVLKTIYQVGGHLGSSSSTIELLTTLYFGDILRYDSKKPNSQKRDYFLLSNGHACSALYAILKKAGFFKAKLANYKKLGSGLEGHPIKNSLPGIETSSGSLGMGLSIGVGLCLGLRMADKKNQVIVMMSDGEQDEGAVWEAAMAASHFKLNRLTAIIDRNKIQIGGFTKNQMTLEPLKEKYESFGWQVLEIDGHRFKEILAAFKTAFQSRKQPLVIIAHTVACKGIYSLEAKADGHHPKISKEIYEKSLKRLRS